MKIPKTILITGGTGFIGSNLCKRLMQDASHRLICVDNNYTGDLENVREFLGDARFAFMEHDITSPLILDEKIDEIYHLACPASPPAYQGEYAILTTKTCVYGTLNMLELAQKNKAKILFSSTSEVYGEPLIHPQPESYRGNVNTIGIRSCYDEGKRCAESLCFDFHRLYGTRIKLIRIFNTYGPMMDPEDGRVVSNFICQALRGEQLTIYGDGSQTRSFCYVDDLVEAIVRMMATPDAVTGPVNMGNPAEFSVQQLAQLVLSKVNGSASVCYQGLPLDDPTQRRPDISLAKKLLAWQPSICLDQGLNQTIAYFTNKLRKAG